MQAIAHRARNFTVRGIVNQIAVFGGIEQKVIQTFAIQDLRTPSCF